MKNIIVVFIILFLFSISGFCIDEWVSPTSFNDPDTVWDNETNAYDNDLGTGASSYNGVDKTWGSFIELNISSVPCDKIRFYAYYDVLDVNEIDVDLYYNDAWNDLYEGAFTDQSWEEKAIGLLQNVTKARVRFYMKKAETAYLYEFEFNHFTESPYSSVTFQTLTEVKVDGEISITMGAPTGTEIGDLLIAYISKDDDTLILETGDYANWNMLVNVGAGTGNCLYVAWRIATATDGSWTWNGDSEDWLGYILRYTGHNTDTPIYDSDYTAQGTANDTPVAPSVDYTDLPEGSLIFQCFGADDDDDPYTVPGELTERFNTISSVDVGGAGGDRNVDWVTPTGFVDETAQWTNEANVYDEDTTTYGYDTIVSGTWGGYLDLTIDAISCNKVRFWALWSASYIDEISLDVYYTGAWHNIYEGTYADKEWIEKEIGSTESVTAMRAKFHNIGASIMVYWYEADFWETGTKTGSTGTATFGMAAAEQWVAATVIIKAEVTGTNWVLPTGHSDPDDKWIREENAYDGGIGEEALVFSTGHYLILTISAITCDRVRIGGYSDYKGSTTDPDIDIDVYYSGAYHNIFSGTLPAGVWPVVKMIGSTETVDKARIKWNVCTAGWSLWNRDRLRYFNGSEITKWNGVEISQMGVLYEFEFGEVL